MSGECAYKELSESGWHDFFEHFTREQAYEGKYVIQRSPRSRKSHRRDRLHGFEL
jgi:hypothetical protein